MPAHKILGYASASNEGYGDSAHMCRNAIAFTDRVDKVHGMDVDEAQTKSYNARPARYVSIGDY